MSFGLLVTVILLYAAILFGIAYFAEKDVIQQRRFFNSPWIYSLSLGVYCTAWTFYGGVASVNAKGFDFLTVYLGPSLMMVLALGVLHKVITIVQEYHITSLSDFMSLRYGKDLHVGVLVTLICLFATIPYVSLQIKALDGTFEVISEAYEADYWINPLFVFFFILLGFSVLFGTRNIDDNERHRGLIVSTSFESVFKLIAILIAGAFISYMSFSGWNDFELNADLLPSLDFNIDHNEGLSSNWFWHLGLSGFAFVLLPRQFQVGVVENKNPSHLKNAMWVVPMYLLLINLFVIPIAVAGTKTFGSDWQNFDFGVLQLSENLELGFLLPILFLGGFSAAFGMIIIESIAVSTMMTNSVILPYWVRNAHLVRNFRQRPVLLTKLLRRMVILLFLVLSFIYYILVSRADSFLFTGFSSFVGVAQIAPAFFVGLFWKQASARGAFWGMLTGFSIYLFLLILPTWSQNINLPILQNVFNTASLFEISGLDTISNTAFWSLSVNSFVFFVVSINASEKAKELSQAVLFVDVYNTSTSLSDRLWKGQGKQEMVNQLLGQFIGREQVNYEFEKFYSSTKTKGDFVANRWLKYVENRLNGLVGTHASQVLISSVTNEEQVTVEEVLGILKETYDLKTLNRELDAKRFELRKLSDELAASNDLLKKADTLKNDFLATVVHEIRSPMTAIQAISEILNTEEDLSREEQIHFTNTILHETNRLKILVDQILDLERYQSGKQALEIKEIQVPDLIKEVVNASISVMQKKGVNLLITGDDQTYKVSADPQKLKQVFHNLLSNAIKFAPDNGGEINICFTQSKKAFKFEITDNGMGISKDQQEHIFEKFYQSDSHLQIIEKGSGLGLSICKAIVDLHKGHIEVNSDLGKGSRFSISLNNIINYETGS